jgi:RNA polymerase sigma factor (sigma-70 family)
VAEANRAFEFVYARNRHKVVGHVLGRFGDRAGSPEVIAAEAWSRVFCDYWSSRARRRFLGLSRISTLVCQVAHHVAFDELRGAGELVTRDGKEDPGLRRVAVVIDHLDAAMDCEDPEARVVAEQLQARLRECLALVPPKQQIVATLVWIRQIQAKRVAEMLGVSDPAISQHLKKARHAIRSCLEAHGFDVPRAVAARKKTTVLP